MFLPNGSLRYGANPWARQFHDDVVELTQWNEDAASCWDRAGGSLLQLFTFEIGQDFTRVDVSILRSRHFDVGVLPPGLQLFEGPVALEEGALNTHLSFTC
eukprot:9503418-Pyramimonas_sp.AAC.1